MQKYKQFMISVVIILSFIFTAFSVSAADITGGNTTINIGTPGDVTGNSDSNGTTNLYDSSIVPQIGDDSAVYSNQVTIKNSGAVHGRVYGGITYGGGAVYNNAVIIENGGSTYSVNGGFSNGNGTVTNNMVEISGTTFGNVFGGASRGNGIVNDNVVVVSGEVNAYVYGGWSNGNGDITGNKVIIANAGKVSSGVQGGHGELGSTGIVYDNTVEIDGTVNGPVYGGWTFGSGDVTDNTVTVNSGGEVYDYVYGGMSIDIGIVSDNSVFISGMVAGNVYGGVSYGIGLVNDNIVNINSTANLTSASLFGRNSSAGGTGNTLNVYSFSGDVVEVNNFDIYNITIGELDSSLTVINITGGTPTDIDGATINISFAPEFAYNALTSGDVITVISNINYPTYTGNDPTVMVASSPFITYDYIETHDTGQLLLTLTGLSVNPETSFVGEGFAAGLAFLGQAADVRSSIYFVPQGPRFIPFAKMVYGKQYISTGSSVNVKGFSAIAGLALNTNFDNGSQLVVGAFVEGGWGDYDSRNSFRNSATIKGSGDTEYYGGGVLARYAMASGLYGEGSFAAGKAETDFKTRDFTPGTRSKYDYSVPYYSTHVGLGQILNLTDMLNLDVYGKYLWTRQAGDNVTVDGNRFKFKDADSHRVRVGGKLKADVSPMLQPYAGAAYEYEFSGRIKGSLYGMNMDKPSLRGGTGIGELGLVWSPTESGNFKVDLGAQGYVGKREGVSGGLTVTMSF